MTIETIYNVFFLGLAMTMMPILVMSATSFVKLSIVFSLLRNALGIQQIPPNLVIYTFALILTGFIMTPTLTEILAVAEVAHSQGQTLFEVTPQIIAPLSDFLRTHVREDHLQFFLKTAPDVWGSGSKLVSPEVGEFFTLLPAFMTSEIVEAFEIGFLLYLPFLAIDMIVSNILLALGMMMLSPVTISLPFKLLLFVAVNGWTLLVNALVLSYS